MVAASTCVFSTFSADMEGVREHVLLLTHHC